MCVHARAHAHTFTVLYYFRLILFIDVYLISMSGYLVFVVCFPSVSLQIIACAQNVIYVQNTLSGLPSVTPAIYVSPWSAATLSWCIWQTVSCAHQMLIVDGVLWSCLKVNFLHFVISFFFVCVCACVCAHVCEGCDGSPLCCSHFINVFSLSVCSDCFNHKCFMLLQLE